MFRRGRWGSILSHEARLVERLLSRERVRDGGIMSSASTIKVGVIADQTGPLSFVGSANANVARMVIGDINAKGGLLGRQLELCLEDSATDDAVAAEKAEKLVQAGPRRRHPRRHLQLHTPGDQGPGRRGGEDALHLPRAVRGPGVRPAHLLHGPGPAQQVDPLIPWLMERRARRRSTCPRPTTSGRTS